MVPNKPPNLDEGSIVYLEEKETLDQAEGFFSFTFYLRSKEKAESMIDKGSRIYLAGLFSYASILRDIFANWKVLIYTDQFSYNELFQYTRIKKEDTMYFSSEYLAKKLFENKNVIFAIVTWPKHQRTLGLAKINGSALRPFRSRAPFDFPTKYVFIRDADTMFEDRLKELLVIGRFGGSESHPTQFENLFINLRIYEWESAFYRQVQFLVKKEGKPLLLVGTGNPGHLAGTNIYLQPYHRNEHLNKKAPFGIFAGFTNTTPNVPVFQTYTAWNEFIDFMNDRSYKLNKTKRNANYSNNGKPEQIGRDEQLYLFLLMPKSWDNLFIFRVNLFDKTLPTANTEYNTYKEYNTTKKETFRKSGLLQGGKRKSLRLKFEKRKTRKHS